MPTNSDRRDLMEWTSIAVFIRSLFSCPSSGSGPYHSEPFPNLWARGIGDRERGELRIGTGHEHGDVQRDECDADEMECDFDYGGGT